MRRTWIILIACLAALTQSAWGQPDLGTLPDLLSLENARITDIGVAVRDVEVLVKTDPLTQKTDTAFLIADPELVLHADSLSLGTYARTVCPQIEDKSMRLDDYASKLQDGSYKSYAYSMCLPFDMTRNDIQTSLNGSMKLYTMEYIDEMSKCFAFTDNALIVGVSPQAGRPYLLEMVEGQFQPIAHDTQVRKEPLTEGAVVEVLSYNGGSLSTVAGSFKGTFQRIDDTPAPITTKDGIVTLQPVYDSFVRSYLDRSILFLSANDRKCRK